MPNQRNTHAVDTEVYNQAETHQGALYYAELLGLPVYVKE